MQVLSVLHSGVGICWQKVFILFCTHEKIVKPAILKENDMHIYSDNAYSGIFLT